MTQSKRFRPERDISPTHPNAAAIDIGARMHVAAVAPDRDTEPVRTFGTCTGDLRRLCCASITVRTRDNQDEKAFCRLRRREGGARPEAQATEELA